MSKKATSKSSKKFFDIKAFAKSYRIGSIPDPEPMPCYHFSGKQGESSRMRLNNIVLRARPQ